MKIISIKVLTICLEYDCEYKSHKSLIYKEIKSVDKVIFTKNYCTNIQLLYGPSRHFKHLPHTLALPEPKIAHSASESLLSVSSLFCDLL